MEYLDKLLLAVKNDDWEAIKRLTQLDRAMNSKRWRKDFEGYLDCMMVYSDVDLDEAGEIDFNSPRTLEALQNFILEVKAGRALFKKHNIDFRK